jgi:AraC-like DNA-binding protein
MDAIQPPDLDEPVSIYYDFYVIFLKSDPEGKFNYRYGQKTIELMAGKKDQENDYVTSKLFFMSPGQLLGIERNNADAAAVSGWMMLIHPDYLWKTRLAKAISQYEFFHYSMSESLYLAPQEEKKIIAIIKNIEEEYRAKIDNYSQDVIIVELELLLTYAERFYNRQFVTRKITNHGVLEKLEELLDGYFNDPELLRKGLPTVQYISGNLNISPNYLRSLLKSFTGLNTQEHIHKKLIEKAKEKLSTTDHSVSEIAYELGFEHPPSFSKLFKSKTQFSPVEFRQSFT